MSGSRQQESANSCYKQRNGENPLNQQTSLLIFSNHPALGLVGHPTIEYSLQDECYRCQVFVQDQITSTSRYSVRVQYFKGTNR